MRTQWTAKGNRDAGSSCLCDRGLHRYLRNFGGGGILNTPTPPLGTPLVTSNISLGLDRTVIFRPQFVPHREHSLRYTGQWHYCTYVFAQSVCYSCVMLMEMWLCRWLHVWNSTKIHPVEFAPFHLYRRTDMTQLTATFRRRWRQFRVSEAQTYSSDVKLATLFGFKVWAGVTMMHIGCQGTRMPYGLF